VLWHAKNGTTPGYGALSPLLLEECVDGSGKSPAIAMRRAGQHLAAGAKWRTGARRVQASVRPGRQPVAAYSTGTLVPALEAPERDMDSTEGITVVSTRAAAQRVMDIISKLPLTTYHAWDTEVAAIDVTNQSPVGHGRVICASMYSGPNVDYGSGPGVWIENMDDAQVH
jgi:hypothetical protein